MSKHSYSADNAKQIASKYAGQSTSQIFTQTAKGVVSSLMSPFNLSFRESRDSALYPLSKAAIIALDKTSSMSDIPEYMVREKLPKLVEIGLKHGVKDLAVLFMAIGDHLSDRAYQPVGGKIWNLVPLQVGQFESDEVGLNKWLTETCLDGGGGGNGGESYLLGWHVAGKMTSIDCFEKRGEKGFYFSIGDDANHKVISADTLAEIFGAGEYHDETEKELLAAARKMYHVYHIHCTHGRNAHDGVLEYWKDLLGENLIVLDDKAYVAEVIASTIAMYNGVSLQAITSDFDPKTALAVNSALAHIDGGTIAKKSAAGSGIAKF